MKKEFTKEMEQQIAELLGLEEKEEMEEVEPIINVGQSIKIVNDILFAQFGVNGEKAYEVVEYVKPDNYNKNQRIGIHNDAGELVYISELLYGNIEVV